VCLFFSTQRDSSGKEMRFPIILSLEEKMIARKVVLAFKYQVCGFDLLRHKGKVRRPR
jgi:inositol hexakisphosphate/diphosphoinositol-pentakisphosphate kinase